AGYYSPAVIPYACYWKNGQRVNLSTVRSKAHNMTVVTQGGTQGGTPVIYAAGFYVDDGIDKPCYWRNGQRTSLYSSSWSETSEALAIMVVNSGGIYVAGYCSDETINQMTACYWINGERKLIPAGNGSFANAIFVIP
ncbi:MAG: hypothetical protein LBG95_08080, partial [Treponema sp.]|nr:hypothetical protein [Treponema sp.]